MGLDSGGYSRLDLQKLSRLGPHKIRSERHALHIVQRALDCGINLLDFLGITEGFSQDTNHDMLARAVADDCWDVVMVGFNLLNQSARERVLQTTQAKQIGVLAMFAVRRALRDRKTLATSLAQLKTMKGLDLSVIKALEAEMALDFLFHSGGAESLTDAAYRFCRYEPGVDVVMFGTGSFRHLDANVRSLLRPPLPEDDVARLKTFFAGITQLTGN